MSNNLIPGARQKRGMALIFALIILAVLATMAYSTASRLVAVKHRRNYIFNYYKAKYACDSATRYGIAKISDFNFELKSRDLVPDFSDVFAMNEDDYNYLMYEWASQIEEMRMNEFNRYMDSLKRGSNPAAATKDDAATAFASELLDMLDIEEANYFGADTEGYIKPVDANSLFVPGPYGTAWPYISEPLELEICDSVVTITIEDENAKLPIVWALMQDQSKQGARNASMETFFEWMGVDKGAQEQLIEQFDGAAKVKNFEIGMKPASIEKNEEVKTRTVTQQPDGTRKSEFRTRYRVRKVPRSDSGNYTDFARLVSAKVNTELLKKNSYSDFRRDENAMKYLGLWGSDKVNVNTAPRNVLEAAFVFGGQEVRLADSVIAERKVEPFKDVEDMKRRLFSFSNNIDNLADMILFESEVFTIKIKAVSGSAVATSTTAVLYKDKKFTKITTVYN